MIRVLVLVVGLALLHTAPSVALAAGLRYDVVAGCPAQERFEERVADDCELSSLDMNIAVQREARGFRLTLLIQSADGSYPEEKSAPHCEQLIELAAHVARRVCQPKPEVETTATQSSLEPRAVTNRAPAARAPRDSGAGGDRSSAAALAQRVWAGAGVFAQTGTAPGLDAAVALDLGVDLGMHSLALGASGWLPRTLNVELAPGIQTPLELKRFSLQLQNCLRSNTPNRARVGHWGFGACVNAGYQVVSSYFPAGTQPRDYRSWPSVGAGLSALRKLSKHFVVEAQVGGDVNIAAAPVTAQPFGAAHDFGTIAGFVGTRLIWVFEPLQPHTVGKSDPSGNEPRESTSTRALTDRNAW